jgi:hypothetical protein
MQLSYSLLQYEEEKLEELLLRKRIDFCILGASKVDADFGMMHDLTLNAFKFLYHFISNIEIIQT